jgi:hypothetical protein
MCLSYPDKPTCTPSATAYYRSAVQSWISNVCSYVLFCSSCPSLSRVKVVLSFMIIEAYQPPWFSDAKHPWGGLSQKP